MKRRETLKLLATGSLAASVLGWGCKTATEKPDPAKLSEFTIDRNEDELLYEKKLKEEADYFTKEEMATITILADIIIPKDAISGSASDAKVPEFIAFIVKDMPHYKVPLRGGLRWLDVRALKLYEKSFADISPEQRIAIVDTIAYPEKVADKPELAPGVSFFTLMRNLTCTGFYTTEIGIKDLQYTGNAPNRWNGVPDDVLQHYNLAYSERELKESVKFDANG